MDKLYDRLEEIRVRPGMYLGAESITILNHFITGYNFALHDTKQRCKQLYPLPFSFFQGYCGVKYQDWGPMSDWANILLKQCENKEKDALWLFFEVLDEFKEKAKVLSCELCELSEENISFHLTEDSVIQEGFYEEGNWIEQPIYQNVKMLYRIRFSYQVVLLLPVSYDAHAWGHLFYPTDKESGLAIFENIEKHMEQCFGVVSWQEIKPSEEQMLSLLNDYIFENGTKNIWKGV